MRGMATTTYYLARHYVSGMLGWGPSYKLTIVQEDSAKGLQQVRSTVNYITHLPSPVHLRPSLHSLLTQQAAGSSRQRANALAAEYPSPADAAASLCLL